jgi:TRAP-type C4-dicarboxylate transport system substrate-binding protein
MNTRARALWLLLGLSCCGTAAQPGAQVIRLRFASPYGPMHPFSRADRAWIEHVQAAAQQRLQIEAFWSGSLISTEQSLLELRHGVADVAVVVPIAARGGAHALRMQTGFYAGASSFEQQVAVYKCLARQFSALDHELSGLRVLAVQGGSLPGVFTRERAVRSLEDLRGLRLRAPTELLGILKTLGADPVHLPMSEVYSALAKGVIDGVIAPSDTLKALHFAEVGHYFTQLAIPRGAYPARAISLRALQRLPPDLQQLLIASSAFWETALAHELELAARSGSEFGRAHGVSFLTVPAAEQMRFDAAYNLAARETAKRLNQRGVDGTAMFERAQALIPLLGPTPSALEVQSCPG